MEKLVSILPKVCLHKIHTYRSNSTQSLKAHKVQNVKRTEVY